MLRAARRRAGLSQRELARRAGVPQSAVARIENGTVVPRVDTLDRLLAICGEGLEAVARKGIGIDRSLIRERLKRTPRQRLEEAAQASEGFARMRGRGRRPA